MKNTLSTHWLCLSLLVTVSCVVDQKNDGLDSGGIEFDMDADTDADVDADEHTTMVFSSTDYMVYSLGTLDLETRGLSDSLTALPGDATVSTLTDGRIYNLNRFGYDVLRIYDQGQWDSPVLERSVGDGTANPHGVVLCADELYVGLYGDTIIKVLNPSTGALAGAVDLSDYAEGDDIAEVTTLLCRDERIFAVAQQLDSAWRSEGGTVLEIDTASKTVVASHPVSPNPRAYVHPTDSDTLVLFSGHFGEGDGGLHTFDLTTGIESASIVADADLGITFSTFAGWGDKGVILGNSYDYTSTVILCVDLTDWSMTEGLVITGYTGTVSADNHGTAWIGVPVVRNDAGDVMSPTGLQAFDIDTCTASGDLIETTLGPSSIDFY